MVPVVYFFLLRMDRLSPVFPTKGLEVNLNRKVLMACGSTLLAGAGALSLASPAWAGGTFVDNGNGSITVTGLSNPDSLWICPVSVSVANCGGGTATYGSNLSGTYSAGSTVNGPGGQLPAGTYTISVGTANTALMGLSPVVIGNGGGGNSASSSAPAPVVQEFGKPASGTCDAAQPAGLNWAGVSSGGWANSWSQWMNGGNGGFVCARTLIYSTTQAKWIVG